MDHELWTPRFSPLVPGPGLRRYCDVRVSLPAPVNVPPHLCFFFHLIFFPCSAVLCRSLAGPRKAYLLVRSVDPSLKCISSIREVVRLNPRKSVTQRETPSLDLAASSRLHIPYCLCPPSSWHESNGGFRLLAH
ncbi:hypothetical protein BO85DRAFT_447090 [Aspergillus piperis CBS 112811]|uniref:Uncharacterized protein n=1 Tax=Aspergillus piperis CBS 112811 TaxID=1448313 RepID=A0A8G1VS80_9EURO|nr:hypothetical protein BO85DRAFT_447090 [Aspergillus piperis CBS 112811]RAH60533.1 hypothetical protein BO85DRAFT_447090 [Aspergillus piperis CBS 112811]